MADAGNPIPAPPSDAESLWRLARQLDLSPLEIERAFLHAWQEREFERAGHREVTIKLRGGDMRPAGQWLSVGDIWNRIRRKPFPLLSG